MNSQAPVNIGTLVDINIDHYEIEIEKVKKLSNFICAQFGFRNFELSISFVDNESIRSFNLKYRNKDKPTDVLSFPQESWHEPLLVGKQENHAPDAAAENAKNFHSTILGDLLISLDEAAENAKRIGQTLDEELAFLIVHGILHLLGHDHLNEKDEEIMTREQRTLMSFLSQNSPPLWKGMVNKMVDNI